MSVHHKLQTKWCIWEQVPSNDKDVRKYKEGMAIMSEFETVESFWQSWPSILQPRDVFQYINNNKVKVEMEKGADKYLKPHSVEALGLFRGGIRPEWEDPANSKGGELQVRSINTYFIIKIVRRNVDQIQEMWEHLVFALIGETLNTECLITGARIVDKTKSKGSKNELVFRIEIWYNTQDDNKINELEDQMRKMLKLSGTMEIKRIPHENKYTK